MSNIDKQALRERYSPKPVPECHICGKEMTIQRISASRITYGCTGATYDDKGCHYAEGRSIADDHYEQSRVTVVDVSDPDVLALLDENLQLQREKDAIEAVALALRDDMRQAREKLEAAERRTAELEAREISLPERSSMLYRTDFHEDYHTVMAYKVSDVIAAIRAAGIGVKQQEDSVDSDVGRNQPGMVVAVHIGAGDFVKVKGQVFEVEETDFDDHDVTLWFVGGNALKCSAGCPVEVVSALVAAGIKVKGE
ncbi:ead/Ea22-like family protein [Salmonella enterica subsp. enterica]|nr:ead/Ea22-like family protein [Salmonella enterica subsp. enterica serovar Panama]